MCVQAMETSLCTSKQAQVHVTCLGGRDIRKRTQDSEKNVFLLLPLTLLTEQFSPKPLPFFQRKEFLQGSKMSRDRRR